jgi:hypothetical protein
VDDVAILQAVYRYRFVRAEDLYRLFPARSPDRLSRRLTLLYRAGYLDRPPAQIDRYKQGGSQFLVYGLDTLGARFLKEQRGVSIGSADWRSRNSTYTRENLDHALAVSRFLVDLEVAFRERPNVQVITFDEILATAPEKTRSAKSPGSWPVPVQWSGGRATVYVAPDAIFGLRLVDADEKARRAFYFLEIDRGTMTIVPSERVRQSDAFPHRSTVVRKLCAYADSFRLSLHKEVFGFERPRVLFVTTSAARAEAMRRAAHDLVVQPLRLPAGMFLFGSCSNGKSAVTMRTVDASNKEVSFV